MLKSQLCLQMISFVYQIDIKIEYISGKFNDCIAFTEERTSSIYLFLVSVRSPGCFFLDQKG